VVARRRRRSLAPADVALAATLHDPPGALLGDLRRSLPRLAALYRGLAIATSPPTSPRVRALLAAVGVHAGTPAANLRGPLYRLALRRALGFGTARLHYVDLDRALHWVAAAPRELASVLRAARHHEVVVLGRTPRAHRSHHLPLFATEVVANRLMADRLAVDGRLDLLVPSFTLGRDAARALLARSRARDAAVYGEWAALVAGAAPALTYRECRGLEWETPDRHRRAVRRGGLAAWRRRQETPAEWARRVALARDVVAGFTRTLARWPAAPALRRVG
jgi:hypothetical protein